MPQAALAAAARLQPFNPGSDRLLPHPLCLLNPFVVCFNAPLQQRVGFHCNPPHALHHSICGGKLPRATPGADGNRACNNSIRPGQLFHNMRCAVVKAQAARKPTCCSIEGSCGKVKTLWIKTSGLHPLLHLTPDPYLDALLRRLHQLQGCHLCTRMRMGGTTVLPHVRPTRMQRPGPCSPCPASTSPRHLWR